MLHWRLAEIEEFDRLFESKTMKSIHPHDQLAHRRKDTSYYNPQIKEKEDSTGNRTYRVRGTIGGDRINYPEIHLPTRVQCVRSSSSLSSATTLVDIKDYHLNTPLSRPEYIRIQRKLIPNNIMERHKLDQFISNNSEVNRGMYGLPQAGLLAQQRLVEHLAKHQYYQTDTPCLFRHASNGTTFALVVDDFGVKYKDKQAADHFIATLQQLYTIKSD